MKLFRFLRSKFSMKLQYVLFWDAINGKAVCLYEDCFGTEWLAQSKFGFRIKRT